MELKLGGEENASTSDVPLALKVMPWSCQSGTSMAKLLAKAFHLQGADLYSSTEGGPGSAQSFQTLDGDLTDLTQV